MARLSRRRVVLAVRVALAGVALARWAFDRVEVEGASMLPTFTEGDRLLLVRRCRALRTGDLVCFADPREEGRRLVKRVSSLHGDDVEVRGDNPGSSTDSRDFGPIPASSVTHLVARRYLARTAP
jgi:nickel-type superoxide dismutase maturation protease